METLFEKGEIYKLYLVGQAKPVYCRYHETVDLEIGLRVLVADELLPGKGDEQKPRERQTFIAVNNINRISILTQQERDDLTSKQSHVI